MDLSWDDRVAAFWASVDDAHPEQALTEMRRLVDERSASDPAALFEWASVHDFLGLEVEAVPLYRAALDVGLAGDLRSQAVVQLASSLRNIGDAEAAIGLLENLRQDAVIGAAGRAFLALALLDAGRPAEALRIALQALAPTLPRYGRAVDAYADALVDEGPTDRPSGLFSGHEALHPAPQATESVHRPRRRPSSDDADTSTSPE